MTPVYWSAWGLDWEDVSAERIAASVTSELSDGAIVLLHDSARFGRRRSALPTAAALESIAAWARERQISLTTIGDAVGDAAGHPVGDPAGGAARASQEALA